MVRDDGYSALSRVGHVAVTSSASHSKSRPFSYNAAWRMRHKLMQVMMERDREHVLGGFIQLDDAYLGGERSGGKRERGAPGKTPFVAAVETNEAGHPQRVKLTVVEGFRLTEIAAWAQQHLSPGTQVLSDGLTCFNGVTAAGCVHEPMVTGGGKAAVERPEFRWVNTILGNIKTALRGTYHAVRPKYAQRYLAEFEYRFNRRFDLPDIIPRLVYVALRTPPMPGTATQVALSLRGNQDDLIGPASQTNKILFSMLSTTYDGGNLLVRFWSGASGEQSSEATRLRFEGNQVKLSTAPRDGCRSRTCGAAPSRQKRKPRTVASVFRSTSAAPRGPP